jgi:hypothetical protein
MRNYLKILLALILVTNMMVGCATPPSSYNEEDINPSLKAYLTAENARVNDTNEYYSKLVPFVPDKRIPGDEDCYDTGCPILPSQVHHSK